MLYTVHLKSLSDKCVVFRMYVYVRGTNMYTMWYERVSRWYENGWYNLKDVAKVYLGGT